MDDPTKLSWIESAMNICTLLVAIGVAGEFVGSWIASPIRKRIDGAKDAEIAHLNKQAAEAMQQAAEANRATEEEKLARAKIEERLAPRILSPEQQSLLVQNLKPLAGKSVDILMYGDTPEIVGITRTITSQMTSAGLNAQFWSVVGGGAVTGILVLTRSGSDSDTQHAAGSILSALHSVGLVAVPWQQFTEKDTPGLMNGPPWSNDKTAPIRMLIGTKP